jgi:hypothetical protein
MTLKAPPKPCGSCPYRQDVPSGIWHEEEYAKLASYDGNIIEQLDAGALGVFMCHQRDGCLCGGWLATHGPKNLLALRVNTDVDPSVADYETDVPVWPSGVDAAAHGMKDIDDPSPKAQKVINGLMKLPGIVGADE